MNSLRLYIGTSVFSIRQYNYFNFPILVAIYRTRRIVIVIRRYGFRLKKKKKAITKLNQLCNCDVFITLKIIIM